MGRFRLKYLFSFYQNKEVDRTWHKIPVNYIRPGKKGNNYLADVEQNRTASICTGRSVSKIQQ